VQKCCIFCQSVSLSKALILATWEQKNSFMMVDQGCFLWGGKGGSASPNQLDEKYYKNKTMQILQNVTLKRCINLLVLKKKITLSNNDTSVVTARGYVCLASVLKGYSTVFLFQTMLFP